MATRSKLRGEDGAAAVEFALVVSLLFILLFGIMEFGLAFFELQNLRSATREGARAAAIGGNDDEISAVIVQGSSGSVRSATAPRSSSRFASRSLITRTGTSL